MKPMRVLASIVSLFLVGCQTKPIEEPTITKPDPGPYPSNYRQIVRDAIPVIFKDPESARNLMIVPPRSSNGSSWSICLIANAKNSYGGYTGLQAYYLEIEAGQIDPMSLDVRIMEFGRRLCEIRLAKGERALPL